MSQDMNTRFAFILGTQTDTDPQIETGFEIDSDRDYEISYKIMIKKYRQKCTNRYHMQDERLNLKNTKSLTNPT